MGRALAKAGFVHLLGPLYTYPTRQVNYIRRVPQPPEIGGTLVLGRAENRPDQKVPAHVSLRSARRLTWAGTFCKYMHIKPPFYSVCL